MSESIAESVDFLNVAYNGPGHLQERPHVGQLLKQVQLFKKVVVEVLIAFRPPQLRMTSANAKEMVGEGKVQHFVEQCVAMNDEPGHDFPFHGLEKNGATFGRFVVLDLPIVNGGGRSDLVKLIDQSL